MAPARRRPSPIPRADVPRPSRGRRRAAVHRVSRLTRPAGLRCRAGPAPGPDGTAGTPRRAAASFSGPAGVGGPDAPGTAGRESPPVPEETSSWRRNLAVSAAFPAFNVGITVEDSVGVDLGLRAGLVPRPVAGRAGHEAQDELLVGRPEVPARSLTLSRHETESAPAHRTPSRPSGPRQTDGTTRRPAVQRFTHCTSRAFDRSCADLGRFFPPPVTGSPADPLGGPARARQARGEVRVRPGLIR